jgi:hypothetical protein
MCPTYYLLFIYKPYYDYYFSPFLTKNLVGSLVNLTNEVVQLPQPIPICLKEKGNERIRGG